jgi:hypothetical protein
MACLEPRDERKVGAAVRGVVPEAGFVAGEFLGVGIEEAGSTVWMQPQEIAIFLATPETVLGGWWCRGSKRPD